MNLACSGITPETGGGDHGARFFRSSGKNGPLDRLLLDLQEGLTEKRGYQGLEMVITVHLRMTEEAFQALNLAGLDPPEHVHWPLVHKMVQAQEYGLPVWTIRDLLFNAGSDRWSRLVQALDIGMTLKLAGLGDADIEAYMLDSLGLELSDQEINRLIKYLLTNKKAGRTTPEIRKSLGFGPGNRPHLTICPVWV